MSYKVIKTADPIWVDGYKERIQPVLTMSYGYDGDPIHIIPTYAKVSHNEFAAYTQVNRTSLGEFHRATSTMVADAVIALADYLREQERLTKEKEAEEKKINDAVDYLSSIRGQANLACERAALEELDIIMVKKITNLVGPGQ